MPYKEITEKHLNELKQNIQKVLSNKNIDNTGSASDSLRVADNALYGNSYIYYLDQGRGPGRFPPVENMRDWVRSKLGISGKEVNSIAFLVGRKIASEGTKIYLDKSQGLQIDLLIDEMLQNLYKDLPLVAKAQAKTFLKI